MKAIVSRVGTGEEAEVCLPPINDIESFYSLCSCITLLKKQEEKNSTHRGNNSMIERNGKWLFTTFTVARGRMCVARVKGKKRKVGIQQECRAKEI